MKLVLLVLSAFCVGGKLLSFFQSLFFSSFRTHKPISVQVSYAMINNFLLILGSINLIELGEREDYDFTLSCCLICLNDSVRNIGLNKLIGGVRISIQSVLFFCRKITTTKITYRIG